MATPSTCYHCGEPVPAGLDLTATIAGVAQPMCCAGCQAVARAIVDAGMSDYYRRRSGPAATAAEIVPEHLRELLAYDDAEVQRSFVSAPGAGEREAALILEGITCAACVWLNERHVMALPGVTAVSVNYATHRARVRWDPTRIRLSEILAAIERIGYRAHPYDPEHQQALLENERRAQLRRLGVAGVFGMQVMMLAIGLYGGDFWGIDPGLRGLMTWISLLLTLPVLLISARPFFERAITDLRNARAGMDVPVALGIALAFTASVWHTWRGEGAVYFDSVAMFTFFLLGARYLELAARKRSIEAGEGLLYARPMIATRIAADGTESDVAAGRLAPGDRVRIRPGATLPADGRVIEGASAVDESLLTGESRPVAKRPGDPVVAGSVNVDQPLVIGVERAGHETVLAGIQRMLEQAQNARPAVALLADRIAGWFVFGLVAVAAVVAFVWLRIDPERWLAVTVSVLVVACPCALSLATPAAVTAAIGRLTTAGFLVKNPSLLETLARADTIVFDKTGTLTRGRPRLIDVDVPRAGVDCARATAIAAALERGSEHPLARAIVEAAGQGAALAVTERHNQPGAGISGQVDGVRYWLGAATWLDAQGLGGGVPSNADGGHTEAILADGNGVVARFRFDDAPRPGATALIDALRAHRLRTVMLSGDAPAVAEALGAALGIDEVYGGLTPQAKLEHVDRLTRAGAVTIMVGDGVNDAPALARAHGSIAMGSGTQLAAVSADAIQMGLGLESLSESIGIARRAERVIRQNLAWALGYNLLMLPAAAAGLVSPWLAALGMSLSSLVVIANAVRLQRQSPRTSTSPVTPATLPV
ncbi:MAG: cadmium-translocating P-type ATPase [Chromatiales bacterium]|nr:cadmium-translocating P-type ATPase [Chromatiales bacterium]